MLIASESIYLKSKIIFPKVFKLNNIGITYRALKDVRHNNFTSLPRSATMPALKVGDLPLPLHQVHADLTCHQNENKHV